MIGRSDLHYLDNSATTEVLREAAETAVSFMTESYGNPSSLHTMGFRAKCALDEAREKIAGSIAAQPAEVYFTSGGTESNNLAVLGAADARKRLGNKIVTTAAEHPSVLMAMKELEKQGFRVEYLPLDSSGNIKPDQLEQAVDTDTILVSMMLVNNETGSIFPVEKAARIIKKNKAPALLHTDAVQAYLKLPLSPKKLGADMISISGHKVHGPKGIGALYLSKNARISQRVYGGGQEQNLRSGTEAVPLIAAFGKAVEASLPISRERVHIEALNSRLRKGLSEISEVSVNSPSEALPYIMNFSAGQVRAETMLHFLAAKEIYVSSGSACGKAKPSHVLSAMGLCETRIASSIRVSFSRFNTEEDVDALLRGLKEGLSTIKVG